MEKRELGLLPIVDRVLKCWESGMKVGDIVNLVGISQKDVFAITMAHSEQIPSSDIADRLSRVVPEMDSIEVSQTMGVKVENPELQRIKNDLVNKWLLTWATGGNPDPDYNFDEQAAKILDKIS